MGKYGEAAVKATKLFLDGHAKSPNQAWEMAIIEIYPDPDTHKAARKKSCPRDAYLGLCESGEIIGILKGTYCDSMKNKDYAIKALSFLRNNHSLLNGWKTLWNLVMDGQKKSHNNQMDLVISLWKAGFIE
jgi:hypothetical protein